MCVSLCMSCLTLVRSAEDIDDDSDDDVNVVIRDIAAPSAYTGFKIKGSAPFGTPAAADKAKVSQRSAPARPLRSGATVFLSVVFDGNLMCSSVY